MTRVLLVGSGAREHAIAASLVKSSEVQLYAAMSSRNPAIMRLAKESTVLPISDPRAVTDYAKQTRAELVFVGPEAPLVKGVVNTLNEIGIRSVGPTQKLASLEGDKAFCRELLDKHDIPGNPLYRVFTDIGSAESFLKTAGPVAIKPAGLTGGKGVKVSGEDLRTKEDEVAYAREVLCNRVGDVQRVVVEEKLEGEEYSLQAFVDGNSVHVMPLVQDHKRAYEHDSGPNTGGMGSYSDCDHLLPFVSREDLEFSSGIMLDVVRSLNEDTGEAYRGILYGQFMLAKGANEEKPAPKLIEFNCRFGDPEAMNVLPILTTDFAEVCLRIAEGTLKQKDVSFDRKATVCKYLVPMGYPEHKDNGHPISIDTNAVARCGAQLFYANVDMSGERVVTTASRTIGLVGISDTIEEAERIAEEATAYVKGPLRHRRDIGTSSLIQKRINHMKILGADLPPAKALQVGIQ
ncbi:MAG TPA: phosphoribosylamine--glycine ligase [Terriglobales bacterium]|nr:phosphoribosylamine--glycine ligase [Terriglobales bacterium]